MDTMEITDSIRHTQGQLTGVCYKCPNSDCDCISLFIGFKYCPYCKDIKLTTLGLENDITI